MTELQFFPLWDSWDPGTLPLGGKGGGSQDPENHNWETASIIYFDVFKIIEFVPRSIHALQTVLHLYIRNKLLYTR